MKKPNLRAAAASLAGGLTLVMALAVAGCGGDLRYIQPAIYQFKTQKLIQSDFLEVWNRLETNIPAGFFTRSGTGRDGRTINVSFISDKPAHMVDCGRTTRYYSSQKGHNVYDYNPADSAVYTVRDPRYGELNVTRTARLRGETTIYLAEQGAATSVAVNTKYTLEVSVVYFDFENREISSDNFTFTFTSENDHIESGFICTANGSLERKILSYAE